MSVDLLGALYEAARNRVRMHGKDMNERKCVEEMAELTAALSHVRDGKVSGDQVAKEIADVLFTAVQVAHHYGLINVLVHLWRIIHQTNKLYKEAQDGKEN